MFGSRVVTRFGTAAPRACGPRTRPAVSPWTLSGGDKPDAVGVVERQGVVARHLPGRSRGGEQFQDVLHAGLVFWLRCVAPPLLIASHGQELCNDWRRCRALLEEQCPQDKKEQVVYQPRVLGIGEVVFADKRRNLEYRRTYRYLALPPGGDGAITWNTAEAPGITLADTAEPAVQWGSVPESLKGPKKLAPPHESSNSRSSRSRVRIRLLSALMMASARSRLLFCSSRIFSSTVSRAISR
jgi:hypothetical protein